MQPKDLTREQAGRSAYGEADPDTAVSQPATEANELPLLPADCLFAVRCLLRERCDSESVARSTRPKRSRRQPILRDVASLLKG